MSTRASKAASPDPLIAWTEALRRTVAQEQMLVRADMKLAETARDRVIVAGVQAAVQLAYKLFPDAEEPKL